MVPLNNGGCCDHWFYFHLGIVCDLLINKKNHLFFNGHIVFVHLN